MLDWYTAITALVEAVAAGGAGQAGSITVRPPDERVPVRLTARKGSIVVVAALETKVFTAAEAVQAVACYAASVEGCS